MSHNQRKNRLKPSDEERAKLIDLIWEACEPMSDDDVEAWFSPPWRRVEYALQLALCAGDMEPMAAADRGARVIHKLWYWRGSNDLQNTVDAFLPSGMTLYEYVQDAKVDLVRSPEAQTLRGLFLRAAFECVAKWVARSDGGGHAYNIYLAEAARQAIWRGMLDEQTLGNHMLAARIHDALGHAPAPKLVESFRIAWRAGRTNLAYLLATPA
jgi:hypothetical protein